jgi:hypothetical protein
MGVNFKSASSAGTIELNRFFQDARESEKFAVSTSSIGTNQTYSDFMARSTAFDFTVAGSRDRRAPEAIALPMAVACVSVTDEGLSDVIMASS